MFCTQCGVVLVPNAKFCSHCGQSIDAIAPPVGAVAVEKASEAAPADISSETQLGTKWLKFWNYFSLPVGGVLGLLMTLGIPAFGIIMVPLAVLQFVVAYGLHHRRLWAWKWNWALIVLSYLSALNPTAADGSANLVEHFVIVLILGGLIWMWPNYVYWTKRKRLFS
jgi:hypothetical protein